MKSSLSTTWKWLISVRLTIFILLFIILFCILGTIVAQQGMTALPLEKVYSPEKLKWLRMFGLTDVFHSPYFIFLLFALATNLVACSIERLPKIWKHTFHVTPPPTNDPFLKSWTQEEARRGKYLLQRPGHGSFATLAEAKMALQLFFERRFGKTQVLVDSPEHFQVMVEKGKYSRIGVYITHLSLLMIMFGGVLGAIFGFEAGMSIEEGSRQSWLQHMKGSTGGLNLFRENGLPVKGFLNLGFDVECKAFRLETYDGSRPKSFQSDLNFYENDVKVASATIGVNTPFHYKGITFYQASYSDLGVGSADLKVFRTPAGGDHKKATMEVVNAVKPGDLYRIDGNAAFRVLSIEANMMNLGPAAKVQFYKTKQDKKPDEFWVFQNLPGFDFSHRKDDSIHFVIDALKPKFATGLSVAKDPGVGVVWLGAACLILALFIALYTHHARYWVSYSKENGFTIVGWSNKLFLFEPKFKNFYDDLKKELKI